VSITELSSPPPATADADQAGVTEVDTRPPACEPAPAASVTDAQPVELAIAEVAQRTGITAHTLRYYERIGLLHVPRDNGGRRRYTETELARVVFITRLRLTAMPIRDIQSYFRLVDAGPGNEADRLALLERHRDQVKARLAQLQSALDVVEFKIATYGGMCEP
jgi:DNA-binding transcriptional MerR regulator